MSSPSVDRLGKYQLVRHLASGGMARVYLARVDGIGGFQRHVVLKTLRPERSDDDGYLTMFLDEARLVATLHHQHVAQVYEIGVADDGTHFLAMEYLHGETVRSVLERARKRNVRLPLDFCLTVICAAASGLHHAHERCSPTGVPLGIVHRDVSPSNVIIGYDGAIKLIDFGIAMADERSTKTQTGFIKGKAGYMAPEQALGYAVDRRSDVWSLGVVMYELTCQVRAFRASTEHEAVQRIVRGELTPPTHVSPSYPPELEAVVMTALQVDPDDRFQDADAMRRGIELAAHHLGISLGGSVVTRVLADLFGPRREPWLEGLIDEPTTVDADDVLFATPSPRGSKPIATALPAVELVLPDEPTTRFMTVDEPPAVVMPPPPPPPLPAPRIATGSLPPPFTPRAPTVPRIAQPLLAAATDPRVASITTTAVTPPRYVLFGGAFALGVITIGVIAWLMRSPEPALHVAKTAPEQPVPAPKPRPEPQPKPAPVTKPAPATVAVPAPAPAPAAATSNEIAVTITSEPPGAAVMLNNRRIGHTPFTGTLPRGTREVELKLRKSGRATAKREVTLDRDVTWDVKLSKR